MQKGDHLWGGGTISMGLYEKFTGYKSILNTSSCALHRWLKYGFKFQKNKGENNVEHAINWGGWDNI